MIRWTQQLLFVTAAGLVAAAPSGAVPTVPPGTAYGVWRGIETCPLYWHPGAPVVPVPHPAQVPMEPGSRLVDTSGAAALAEARGWIEVGRPDDALATLAAAPPADPRTRLYRLAALAGLKSWRELAAELDSTPAAALPPACGPLRSRWSAQAAMGTGDGPAAAAAWNELARARPALGAYVDLWRLEAAALAGDLDQGLAAWERIVASGLPDEARDRGRAALAALYERGGRHGEARGLFLALAAESRGAERARHWLTAARLADLEGQDRLADELRRRVVAEEPDHAEGVLLDPVLRARTGLPPLEVVRALVRAGRAADAEPFASAVVESRASEPVLQEATLLRASIRAASGNRDGAERDYAAFLSRWPDDSRLPEVLMDRARLALSFRDGALARGRFQEVLVRFSGGRYADDALYLLADSWQDDYGSEPAFADRAIEAFDRLVRTSPGSYFADRSQMRAAHLAFALGRFDEARRRYAAYRGSESAREARYWLGRSLDALGERERAREIWRGLSGGEDWYALLTRDRLAGQQGASLALMSSGYRPAPTASFSDGAVLYDDPAGVTAGALLELGERELARAELRRGLARVGDDRGRLAAWADGLVAWGFPGLALRVGARLGETGAGRRWAYPRGYAETIDAEARAHEIDAYYVMALIRQESLFDPGAVSPVGAVGLMQIMPTTGGEIADSTGWKGYDAELLTDPAISLHFGSRYMEDQLARFEGFWPAVLAAYNGGPHNVELWWSFPERTLDPELWIDRIPYKETRNYVKKVIAQYAIYRQLYADSPASR
ncbi:MAG TPA: transglycosylase SLT domain-containing protein [Gemmatimonadota bacterium]|nr:transglycosylase SLT domain-containing protein [Gemmatimonadota bacterium]